MQRIGHLVLGRRPGEAIRLTSGAIEVRVYVSGDRECHVLILDGVRASVEMEPVSGSRVQVHVRAPACVNVVREELER